MDKKNIRIYNFKDEQQYKDEKAYWQGKTPEDKLHALETIRKTWFKLNKKSDGDQPRLRRVFRIIEPE